MRRLRIRWTLDVSFGDPDAGGVDEVVERTPAFGFQYTPPDDPEWDDVDTAPIGFVRR